MFTVLIHFIMADVSGFRCIFGGVYVKYVNGVAGVPSSLI